MYLYAEQALIVKLTEFCFVDPLSSQGVFPITAVGIVGSIVHVYEVAEEVSCLFPV
jgi:hypothetical protein